MNARPGGVMPGSFGVRLLVLNGGPEVQALDLEPGQITVGRGPDNDIRLDHPTVSQRHCQIEVRPDGVLVGDLGSTNGTFIDGEPIREAVLKPGQKLRLGDLELSLANEASTLDQANSAREESDLAPPALTSKTLVCANHPRSRARWLCTECQRAFCAGCVKPVKLDGNRTVMLCQACDGLCESLEQARRRALPRGFAAGLVRALVYPLQPPGLVLMAAAVVFNLMLSFSGRLSLLSGFSILLSLGVGAFVLAFLRQVILSSTEGEDTFPAWPEMDFESLKETIFLYLAISVVCFGPSTICRLFVPLDTEGAKLACHALFGLGAFYFPMAVLAVAIHEDAAALNPIFVGVSILRTAAKYIGMCLFLAVPAAAAYAVEPALTTAGMPRLGAGLGGLVAFYTALVSARAIGWFYYCNQETLGW